MKKIEGVGTVWLVYLGGLLRMGSDCILEMGSLTKENQMCGSQDRYLTAREPPWEQNGLPPMVTVI